MGGYSCNVALLPDGTAEGIRGMAGIDENKSFAEVYLKYISLFG